MQSKRKMPVGIQSFEDLIKNGYVYVDKTSYIWKLIQDDNPYFLSRPRRFGKSLLLSTLEAYFLGKRELFDGLSIATQEKDWITYPVLHLDFNAENYKTENSLEQILSLHLSRWEKLYSISQDFEAPELRFIKVIREAHRQSGKQVVVLVDEYDKPLLETIENRRLQEAYRATMKAFYGVLKSEDANLKFVFLTGVTKSSPMSIFSDLNQLRDISMERAYAGICGITEEELTTMFVPEIEDLAHAQHMDRDCCMAELKKRYDGYHFHPEGEGMYNPFSLLSTFAKGEFSFYWFQTGTPTFLVGLIERSGFDLRTMEEGVEAGENAFCEYRFERLSPIPLLYQGGYLTIKGYDREFGIYTLKFPNQEVKYGFLSFFLPQETSLGEEEGSFYIGQFVKDIRGGNLDAFMERLGSILSSVPYPVYGEARQANEQTFQMGCFLIFELMGQFAQTEVHSALGRSDCVVWTKDIIYVFEFKADGSAEDALRQLEERDYAAPYRSDGRKIVQVGVGFDKKKRTIDKWLVKED
ncbi:MAG: ATP-binding protein [Spirochaetia bacterium]|jgi:hypothetical protein|nr:ATP-binding protein [Spirochaetia bacterium]